MRASLGTVSLAQRLGQAQRARLGHQPSPSGPVASLGSLLETLVVEPLELSRRAGHSTLAMTRHEHHRLLLLDHLLIFFLLFLVALLVLLLWLQRCWG